MRGCRSLLDSEIESVKQVLTNTRDYTLFIVGLRTGLRIQELLSIKVSDVIQFDNIVSHLTIARCNMKGKRTSRTIALHPEAQVSILKLINEYNLDSQSYLFKSRKGDNNPISTRQAWNILKTAFRACRLQGRVSCHSTRKSFALRLYNASGKDLLITQRGLGHASLSSTQSYLDTNSETVDNLITKLK